ncbi:serine incorporator 5-like [Erpetoichthys calabaricus]|uniref:serine incorporator 5-like n=1 Tax=Erpetoichthys calabaricus TaxID=27687 RepID=UPI0022349A54|nr:serine incorporator 5-like [Erpetoichthys calabaricus]
MKLWCWQQLCCCCGCAAPSLCCRCLPTAKQSTGTRVMYSLYFLFITIISLIMNSKRINAYLEKQEFYFQACKEVEKTHVKCVDLNGKFAVYKICSGMACFFFTFSILTFKIKNSCECRALLHNGFWLFKFLLLLVCCFGTFYIPDRETVHKVLFYVGAVGALMFIMVQNNQMAAFARNVNEFWKELAKNNCLWYIPLSIVTLLLVVFAFGGFAFLLILYYQTDTRAFIFLIVNLSFCVFLVFLSLFKRRSPQSNPLQLGTICAYIFYLTFSSIQSHGITIKEPDVSQKDYASNLHKTWEKYLEYFDSSTQETMVKTVGSLIMFACVLLLCVNTAAQEKQMKGILSPTFAVSRKQKKKHHAICVGIA